MFQNLSLRISLLLLSAALGACGSSPQNNQISSTQPGPNAPSAMPTDEEKRQTISGIVPDFLETVQTFGGRVPDDNFDEFVNYFGNAVGEVFFSFYSDTTYRNMIIDQSRFEIVEGSCESPVYYAEDVPGVTTFVFCFGLDELDNIEMSQLRDKVMSLFVYRLGLHFGYGEEQSQAASNFFFDTTAL